MSQKHILTPYVLFNSAVDRNDWFSVRSMDCYRIKWSVPQSTSEWQQRFNTTPSNTSEEEGAAGSDVAANC